MGSVCCPHLFFFNFRVVAILHEKEKRLSGCKGCPAATLPNEKQIATGAKYCAKSRCVSVWVCVGRGAGRHCDGATLLDVAASVGGRLSWPPATISVRRRGTETK